MKAEITFRSGTQVLIDMEEFSTKKNRLDGRITELNWDTPEDWERKLHTLDLGEIVCIVSVREAGA